MNKIIRQHYPASRLPEELRPGSNPNASVTVIIEEEMKPEKAVTLEEIFAARRPPFRTISEIDADLRRQRDEWDD